MEKLDVFDIDGNRIREITRGETLNNGEYIKLVHVWVIDLEGNVLIQKRSAKKDWGPNKWATHTGLVSSGETEKQAAIRELKEEINLNRNKDQLIKVFDFKLSKKNRGLGTVYLTFYNEDDDIKVDNDEVVEAKFINVADLKKLSKTKEFIFYGGSEKQNYLYYNRLYAKINELIDVPVASDILNQYSVEKLHKLDDKGWMQEFREKYVELLDKYDYIVGDYCASMLRLTGIYKDGFEKMVDKHLRKRCAFDAPHFILKKRG